MTFYSQHTKIERIAKTYKKFLRFFTTDPSTKNFLRYQPNCKIQKYFAVELVRKNFVKYSFSDA